MSLQVSLVAMAGSLVLGVALALGLVRGRGRLGSFAGLVMLVPLITPEIVTGVAAMLLFKGTGITLSTGTHDNPGRPPARPARPGRRDRDPRGCPDGRGNR